MSKKNQDFETFEQNKNLKKDDILGSIPEHLSASAQAFLALRILGVEASVCTVLNSECLPGTTVLSLVGFL